MPTSGSCQAVHILVRYPRTVSGDTKESNDTVQGVITEALPNALFRVQLENGEEIMAYLAGKMRIHRIKVLLGDTVTVKTDPYGGKGRIVRRM